MQFKDRIKELVELLGISQVELAKAMGVVPSAVGHWVHGTREPRHNRDKLMGAFRVVEKTPITGYRHI